MLLLFIGLYPVDVMATNDPATRTDSISNHDGSADSFEQLFCGCGSLRIPFNGEWQCTVCGQTAPRTKGDEFVLVDPQVPRVAPVIEDEYWKGPKTRERCPECGHSKVHYMIKQLRSSGESETRIFTCAECSHRWREND